MKKKRIVLIIALVLVFLHPKPALANTVSEALTLGVPVSGSLSGTGDAQYYQISVSAGEHLFVVLDGANNANDVSMLYINFGSQPTTIDYDDKGDSANADQAVEIANTEAGTYYVMVLSVTSIYGGNFSIVAHTPSTFPALTVGTAQGGTLESVHDVEYYQVPVSAGEHLFVVLDGANDHNDASMLYIRFGSLPTTGVYDDVGDLANADQAVEIANTQAGTYYVMVISTVSIYGGNYSIVAHTSNTFPTLDLATSQDGNLNGTHDVKYYQVPVSAGEHLFVVLDGANNHNDTSMLYVRYGSLPTTSIYDDKGDSANADQAVEIDSTQAGTYYVMVVCTFSNYGGNYTIVAHTGGTFPTLCIGTSQDGSLQGTHDVKYYQVSVSAGEHLFVVLDGANNHNDTSMLYIRYGSLPTTSLYDDKGDSANADQAVEIDITQSGTYYVMVVCTFSNYGGNYTIVAHTGGTFPTLSIGTSQDGSLNGTHDIKYYQVSVPAGEHLFVVLDGANNHNDTSMLYIRYGSLPTTSLYDDKGDSANADQAVEIDITQSGTYYVMVVCTFSNYGGNYSIVAHTGGTFPTLSIGTSQDGSLNGTHDIKYYQVSVPAGEHLFVVLDGANNYNDTSMLYIRFGALPTTSIYDDKGDSANADQAVEIANSQSGTYYVMVVCTFSNFGGDYTIVAHTTSTFPSLVLGALQKGSLNDTHDIKYYQVSVSAGEHLFVVLDGADYYDTYNLYIKFGALPNISDYDYLADLPDADQAIEIPTTQAGNYYIMICSVSGGGNYALTAFTHRGFLPLIIKI